MSRKVFISHKVRDKIAAEKIRNALSVYGSGNLEIFVSERIEAGREYCKQIFDNLQKTDWLLLLYTDPSEEWDWCLFEAGFFAGCAKNSDCRLVCLHTADVSPPTPLERWQSVLVTDGKMLEIFLKSLYYGINQDLIDSPQRLESLAKEIAGAFSLQIKRKLRSDWHTRYMTLSMDKGQIQELQQSGSVPVGAQCGLKDKESLEIFGRGSGVCAMETLEQGLDDHYKQLWLNALGQTLRVASLNRLPIPRIPVLYSPSSGKHYHVILHCVDRYSDGSFEFYLLFVEKNPENLKEQGTQLQTLGNMLKLGRELRWEVLTKFYRDLTVLNQRGDSQERITKCLEELNWSLDWIIGEAQRMNILTADDVIDAFKDETVREELSDALKKVFPELLFAMQEGVKNADIDKVIDALKGMLRINRQYMIHAAGRYQELLKEMP